MVVATGTTGATGATGPFLSSYAEALGVAQTVNFEQRVMFDPDGFDFVGSDITISADNRTFTLSKTGLYSVEWSVNVAGAGITEAVFGLIEEGQRESGAAGAVPGRISSGALIYVDTVPYTVSLVSFTNGAMLADAAGFSNVAASIRILRFADGAD